MTDNDLNTKGRGKEEGGDEKGIWAKRGEMSVLIVRKNAVTSYAVEYLRREVRIHEGRGEEMGMRREERRRKREGVRREEKKRRGEEKKWGG